MTEMPLSKVGDILFAFVRRHDEVAPAGWEKFMEQDDWTVYRKVVTDPGEQVPLMGMLMSFEETEKR